MRKIYLTIDTECHDITKVNHYIYGKVKGDFYGIKKYFGLFAGFYSMILTIIVAVVLFGGL